MGARSAVLTHATNRSAYTRTRLMRGDVILAVVKGRRLRASAMRREVQAPDGRRYVLEARPVGVPRAHLAAGLPWAFGWLWHHTLARRTWKIEVRVREDIRRELLQWRLPPWWSVDRLRDKEAALAQLDLLAHAIERGNWPSDG